MTPHRAVKLVMHDAEDLAVVSAHVQDAVCRIGDLQFLPRERRFVLLLNRFCWEDAESRLRLRPFRRARAGLHFESVKAVRSRGIRQNDRGGVLSLLALTFEPGEAPGGRVHLMFAGEASLSLEVECVEGALADLGPAWRARGKPRHGSLPRLPGSPR